MASSKDGTSSSRSGILFFSFLPKAFPSPTSHLHLHCLCQFQRTIISTFLEKMQLSVASPLPVPCTQRVPAELPGTQPCWQVLESFHWANRDFCALSADNSKNPGRGLVYQSFQGSIPKPEEQESVLPGCTTLCGEERIWPPRTSCVRHSLGALDMLCYLHNHPCSASRKLVQRDGASGPRSQGQWVNLNLGLLDLKALPLDWVTRGENKTKADFSRWPG